MSFRVILNSLLSIGIGLTAVASGVYALLATGSFWNFGIILWGGAVLYLAKRAFVTPIQLNQKALILVTVFLPVWLLVGSLDSGILSGLELIPIVFSALLSGMVYLSIRGLANGRVAT